MSYNLPYSGDVVKAAIDRVVKDLSDESKQLSTNDFTDEYEEKLKNLENYELPNDVVRDENYVRAVNFSNALKETVSGEAIGITDISPIEHNMGVSVRGKNLLKPSSTKNTATPFTFDASAKDGTITINGTGDNTSYSIMTLKSGASFNNMLIDGETYTFGMDVSVKKIINIIVRATKLSNNSDVYYQAYKGNNYCTAYSCYW